MAGQSPMARLWHGLTGGQPNDDSAFVMGTTDPTVVAQREKLVYLVALAFRVCLGATALTFLTVVIALSRGYVSLPTGLVPVLTAALAVLFAVLGKRFRERPPGAVEVPENLADVISELHAVVADIEDEGIHILDREEFGQVSTHAREQMAASITAAREALTAERMGQLDRSMELRGHIQAHADELTGLHASILELVSAAEAVDFDTNGSHEQTTSEQPAR